MIPSDPMSLLQVADICLQEDQNVVLKEISFSQQEFQRIAIAGETGSGKSTLLQVIAGLVQPDGGQVLFDQKRVKGPAEELVPGHPRIAYLSQQFELPQFLRVEQVLRYANKLSAAEAETLYGVCRISHLLKRKTNQLSGGERQRIALARLLLSRPKLLLLDEPYSNLDMGHKHLLKSVIRDIGDELGLTCILISHDPQDTLSWADEILVLREGQLLQKGSPELIYRQPADEYVAALFGSYNLVGRAGAQVIASLQGIHLNGKSMLIRPESFRVVSAEKQSFPATVAKVNFFGSYYEIEVLLAGDRLRVKTGSCELNPGDTIHLSLAPDGVWFV
jgi:ABC-type Fe3+/spermidine/putrescine transport system ATPase subunit